MSKTVVDQVDHVEEDAWEDRCGYCGLADEVDWGCYICGKSIHIRCGDDIGPVDRDPAENYYACYTCLHTEDDGVTTPIICELPGDWEPGHARTFTERQQAQLLAYFQQVALSRRYALGSSGTIVKHPTGGYSDLVVIGGCLVHGDVLHVVFRLATKVEVVDVHTASQEHAMHACRQCYEHYCERQYPESGGEPAFNCEYCGRSMYSDSGCCGSESCQDRLNSDYYGDDEEWD